MVKNWLNKYNVSVNDGTIQKDRPHEPFKFGDSIYKQIFESINEVNAK